MEINEKDFDANAHKLGMKIKASLLMENVSDQQIEHICRIIHLGLAVEKYLNHSDYELREILKYGSYE